MGCHAKVHTTMKLLSQEARCISQVRAFHISLCIVYYCCLPSRAVHGLIQPRQIQALRIAEALVPCVGRAGSHQGQALVFGTFDGTEVEQPMYAHPQNQQVGDRGHS